MSIHYSNRTPKITVASNAIADRIVRLYNVEQSNLNDAGGDFILFDPAALEGNSELASGETGGLRIKTPGQYLIRLHSEIAVENSQVALAIAIALNGTIIGAKKAVSPVNLTLTGEAFFTTELKKENLVGGFGEPWGNSGSAIATANKSYLEIVLL